MPFLDPFDGVALGGWWSSLGGDDFVVSGGRLRPSAAPVAGYSAIILDTAYVEPTIRLDIQQVGDTGTYLTSSFDGVGNSGYAAWAFDFGLGYGTLRAGTSSGEVTVPAPMADGDYVLEAVINATTTTANLYGSDGTTLLYTVSAATPPGSASELLAGVKPAIQVVGFGGGSSWDDFAVDTVATGGPPPVVYLHEPGMEFSITTLRYPDSTPYPGGLEPIRKHRLTQFTDGEVEIPLDDVRGARVTISVYDPACEDVLPLERFLHVRYRGEVVFWGPMTDPDWDLVRGTVTINALGPEYRLVKHFVRVGDTIGAEVVSEDEELDLRLTSLGMWDLVVCGQNTAGQTTRGVPDLGIQRHPTATGDGGSTSVIKTQRSDQVFGKITQIAESLLGPDFEFVPQELGQGYYARFATYAKQGVDRSSSIKLHYGWGLGNLDGWTSRPSGSSVVTHRHTVSGDGKNRGTAAAEDPSARFGPYVEWDTIDGNAESDVLAEIGKGTVLAYGEPPEFLDVVLKPATNGVSVPHYGTDYGVGDIVTAAARRGFYRRSLLARVTKVTLSQTSSLRATQESLELVPRILADTDVASSEG